MSKYNILPQTPEWHAYVAKQHTLDNGKHSFPHTLQEKALNAYSDNDDFTMTDNRNESKVASGKYTKFRPNSIMLNTGFEIKAMDIFTQYFTFIALDKTINDKKENDIHGDINAKVEIIDHRKNKKFLLGCITFYVFLPSRQRDIFFETLEGYTLHFAYVDDLKKVCVKEE